MELPKAFVKQEISAWPPSPRGPNVTLRSMMANLYIQDQFPMIDNLLAYYNVKANRSTKDEGLDQDERAALVMYPPRGALIN